MSEMNALVKYPGMRLADSPLTEGIIGAWAFAEGGGKYVDDLSGCGHVATATASPTWQDKIIGRELSFNGSTQFLDVGTKSLLNFERTDRLSFVYFGRPNVTRSGAAAGYTIFGKYGAAAAFKGMRFAFQWNGSTKTQAYFYLGNTYGSNALEVYENTFDVTNTPACVIVTYAGTSASSGVQFYYGGNPGTNNALQNTLSASVANAAISFSIGTTNGAASQTFNGGMSLCLVYNRQLTYAEAKAITFRPMALFDNSRLWLPSTSLWGVGGGPPAVASHRKTTGFLGM